MNKASANKASAFHAPLHPQDSETQTFGCRHANPDFCAKNRLPKVCALIRADKMCFAPPFLWPKQFRKLQARATAFGARPRRVARKRRKSAGS